MARCKSMITLQNSIAPNQKKRGKGEDDHVELTGLDVVTSANPIPCKQGMFMTS
jgi:hypothetical protein